MARGFDVLMATGVAWISCADSFKACGGLVKDAEVRDAIVRLLVA